MEIKFKEGDRVRMIEDDVEYIEIKKGMVGTVLEKSVCPFVKFDDLIYKEHLIHKGHCIDGDDLELVVDDKKVMDEDANIDSAHKSSTGSLRLNSGKAEMSQLDPRFLMAMADLMTKSAKKYGKYNWALGQEFHTPFDSAQRHLMRFMSGEDVDGESGLHHLIHAASNLMILWTSQQLGLKELDTRFDWSRNKAITHNNLTEADLENMSKDAEECSGGGECFEEVREFKIGDEVRIVSNSNKSRNSIGDIGIVTEYRDLYDEYRVQVEGRGNGGNWSLKGEIVKTERQKNKDKYFTGSGTDCT